MAIELGIPRRCAPRDDGFTGRGNGPPFALVEAYAKRVFDGGYPNNPSVGGKIHSGTGFGGVGALGGSGIVSSDSDILTEHTREDMEKEEEEED